MKAIEQQKIRRNRQLTAQYMLAVTMIFLVSLSSLLVLRHILQQQEGYASVINMSGRQRMLSQQIALLAHELVENKQEETTETLVEEIHSALNLMEQSHQLLLSGNAENGSGVALSSALSKLYFQPPFEVDRGVIEYLASIRALITDPTHEELSALSIHARGGLLNALNTVVQQYEAESDRNSEILKESAFAIFLLMVSLLIVIVVFGFRPMTNVVVENEIMLSTILDSIPILMDIVRKDGTIRYQSKFLIDLLGESTVGLKCFEAYKTDQAQCETCPIDQEKIDSGTKITTCFDRMGTGTIIEITHLPLVFMGEEAILHTFQDITEQKQTEAFLTRAREEADHASALKSSFLANMSHEIRTPMNAIIGFSELALETGLDRQQQDYLEKIYRSSRSLLGIINDILDFSKVEAGKLTLENRAFCLDSVMEEIVSLFDEKAREKNIGFLIHQQPEVPVFLMGDALRLQQILVNLVANSFKFTDQGEVTIQVGLDSLEDKQVRLTFAVADTGIGIAAEQLDSLFDAFSQADGSSTREYGGTGLGLTISRQLIELLGGEIDVDSEEGKGTIFRFTIPFALAEGGEDQQVGLLEGRSELYGPKSPGQQYDRRQEEAIAGIRGATILLVEDNPINRQVVEEVLRKADITLDTVVNGQQALEKIGKEAGYDAVLMDIQMPVLDGVECVRKLRKREEISTGTIPGQEPDRLPVIAMTANAMQGDREKYLQAGMDDYVAKPIDRAELFAVLAGWIPKERGRRRVQKPLFAARSAQERRKNPKDRRKKTSDRRDIDQVYTLPENLAGFSLAQGLARLEGNVGLYLRLLKEFVTDYGSIVREIREALDKQEQEHAERILHTLKGVAGNLGARDLAAAALTLEQAIKGQGQAHEQLTQFESALQEVLQSLALLSEWQRNMATASESQPPQDDKGIAGLMAELSSMLSEKNFQAGSKWQELQPLLQDITDEQQQQLDQAINNFEFDQASIKLAEIDRITTRAKIKAG